MVSIDECLYEERGERMDEMKSQKVLSEGQRQLGKYLS